MIINWRGTIDEIIDDYIKIIQKRGNK